MSQLPLHDEADVPVAEAGEQPILSRAVQLRLPEYDRTVPKTRRVDQLEEHIWECAVVRGHLAELRLNANTELKLAQDRWDQMQVAAPGKTTVSEVKMRTNPKLAQKLKDAKWLAQRCSEEIGRLDHDQEAASRLYTLIMGS